MESEKRRKLCQSETKQLVDDYTLYRFGHVLSPGDFAKQAGVPEKAIKDLLAQQPISSEDQKKIARSIDVSTELLGEIAGYREMGEGTCHSLNTFFEVLKRNRAAEQARAA